MSRFPTAGHLLAWAGMCPGQNESAGKRKSSRLRKGDPWLKTILVQCAWAATRKKDSYYGAQFKRLRAKRGPKKAICAVAASFHNAGVVLHPAPHRFDIKPPLPLGHLQHEFLRHGCAGTCHLAHPIDPSRPEVGHRANGNPR